MRLFEKIKLINEVFADNELHSQTYKNACLEVLNKYEQQFAIHSVVQQSELLLCKHCDNKKALHSEATGLCPDRFKHFEAK